MIVRTILGAAIAVALMTMPATAQRAPEWDICDGRRGATPDERIRNCTILIESRNASQSERARAYMIRAEVWVQKQDLDRAIADFTAAIKLDPKRIHAYDARGQLWVEKREYDSAIADFTAVIKLDPKLAYPYISRGLARLAKGDRAGSDADLAMGRKLQPGSGQ